LFRDRGETPTTGMAILCGIFILIAEFVYSMAATGTVTSFHDLMRTTLTLQIGVIATIALVMTLAFTRSPRKTLSLNWPRWQTLPLAVALALLIHPLSFWLNKGIQSLYPLNEETTKALAGFSHLLDQQPLWLIVLLLAVTPAICEELAFRGFILSGMRHTGHRWLAIAVSSLFFAITHTVLQQQIAAFFVGLLIGYLALRTSSLLPGMLFHMTHNALIVTMGSWLPALFKHAPWLEGTVVTMGDSDVSYHPAVLSICAVLAIAILYWIHRQPYTASAEERLQHALDHQSPSLMARPEWKLW
jgi:sodium transport system permease protein